MSTKKYVVQVLRCKDDSLFKEYVYGNSESYAEARESEISSHLDHDKHYTQIIERTIDKQV